MGPCGTPPASGTFWNLLFSAQWFHQRKEKGTRMRGRSFRQRLTANRRTSPMRFRRSEPCPSVQVL